MIDTSNWKPFKVSDIFITEKHGLELQVPTGAMMPKKDLADGDVPRVTVSKFNNGITGYYADSDSRDYRTYENFISVSFLGTVFYQSEKVSLDMKVHCLKPLDYELNVYSAGYLVSIIRKAISNFAYLDQLSSTVLAELEFALPATPDGQPDWDYMESYMKAVMEESEKSFENLKEVDGIKHLIDVSGWGEFDVNNFFTVLSGRNKLSNVDIDGGDTPVYSSNSFNGGIFGYTTKEPDYVVDETNPFYVTFGDHTKAVNIADKSFCVMDNVKILTTEIRNYDVLYFIIISWLRNVPDLGYARHWSIAEASKIHLPIDANGKPDWQYMEDYMRRQFNEAESTLSQLQLVM